MKQQSIAQLDILTPDVSPNVSHTKLKRPHDSQKYQPEEQAPKEQIPEEQIPEQRIPEQRIPEQQIPEEPTLKPDESDKHKTRKRLLQHPDLWRAGQLAPHHTSTGTHTGYDLLDQHLPGGGWPEAGLVELLLSNAGAGELRLLVPALKALSAQPRWIAWINPPFIPYAPALEAVGIDISRILLIHPKNHQDTLWSIERACKSGTCSCVMAWPDEKKLKLKDTQRLQVAAKQGRTLSCLFRPFAAHQQASMAELRLGLQVAQPGRLQLDIIKRRGGWPQHNLQLSIAAVTGTQHRRQQDINEQLNLWRTQQTLTPKTYTQKTETAVPGDPPNHQASGDLLLQFDKLSPQPANAENHIH